MNAITEVNQGGALAMQGGYDPFAAYGQEAAAGGTFLKFSRNGEWVSGQNENEVDTDRHLVANMEELSIGWIRWADGKPAERRMGLLVQGFKPEPRDALGYTEESEWELDDENRPKDPWKFTNELPMAYPDDGEQLTFSASSKGGIGAIGNLCKAYGRERAQRAGKVPVIALGRSSYMHPVYKKTYVPVLNIVDWIDNSGIPAPASEEEDATEKPAETKAAAGSKTRF